MLCLSNLSTIIITKPILANSNPPQNVNSGDSEQITNASKPATKTSPRNRLRNSNSGDSEQLSNASKPATTRNRLRNRSSKPSVMQMERIVGAGSFRDADPPPLRDSEMQKTVMDLFLGQAMEGAVEKKMRETGEWLATNAEPKFSSSRKGILMFMFQWMIPIWAMLLLVAYGAIKLPFSSPFLDDLLM